MVRRSGDGWQWLTNAGNLSMAADKYLGLSAGSALQGCRKDVVSMRV
ncbi:MAG: hypothetical protein IPM97_01055 [Bdellovibrionaceae bacterium]|nr:hypothetical protein [Pseudobdellovibrionaceae bacterium]